MRSRSLPAPRSAIPLGTRTRAVDASRVRDLPRCGDVALPAHRLRDDHSRVDSGGKSRFPRRLARTSRAPRDPSAAAERHAGSGVSDWGRLKTKPLRCRRVAHSSARFRTASLVSTSALRVVGLARRWATTSRCRAAVARVSRSFSALIGVDGFGECGGAFLPTSALAFSVSRTM